MSTDRVNILFTAGRGEWADYEAPLTRALADLGITARVADGGFQSDQVDYIVYSPDGLVSDFAPFTRAKAVLSLWAGVEKIVTNPTMTQPLARMVDPGLTSGMVEWVLGHVMRHHLGLDQDITNDKAEWRYRVPPLASERNVGILGIGELGKACAECLARLGFNVLGWSRSAKTIPGVDTCNGDEGLARVLAGTDILVLLLPLTDQTRDIMNADRLGSMKPGAVLLNPGRGPLIDDGALLAALDAGHIVHATLDVFRTEPLPVDHPFWAHSKVTVTPHLASATRPDTAARVLVENIRRGEAGQPFLHLVDRSQGY